MSLTIRKPIEDVTNEAVDGEPSLRRVLGPINLVSLGIGAIIGTGIFVLVGTVAAQFTGPAIVFSILLAGAACAFAGLCYAEFAAMIPAAGSAYTYGYATLGELVAWIIGWDLMLEYLFSAATVAVGWSGWMRSLLDDVGIHITLGRFDWPAALIIVVVTTLLTIGVRESANVNNAMVFVKICVVLVFIALATAFVAGHRGVAAGHWTPFVPPNTGKFGEFGWSGVLRGAGVIFFAYIGFDAVSTTAQEAKNPQRDLPIGMLGSLVICTILYIAVSLLLTGIMPYKELAVPEPIAIAVERIGYGALASMMKVGVVAGLTSVMLVTLLGQTRIFYAMSKDGLLPTMFSRLHPRFRTPVGATLVTGLLCMLVAGTLPLTLLGQLVSIGTLLAFVIVCAGVWYLRVKEPERHRPFRVAFVPFVPLMGILICLGMMAGLPLDTWARLIVWLALGLVVYFAYSRHHSVVRRNAGLPMR